MRAPDVLYYEDVEAFTVFAANPVHDTLLGTPAGGKSRCLVASRVGQPRPLRAFRRHRTPLMARRRRRKSEQYWIVVLGLVVLVLIALIDLM